MTARLWWVAVAMGLGVVAVAAIGVVREASRWQAVPAERAAAVRVGAPADPCDTTACAYADYCCKPAAFDSCQNPANWACVNAAGIFCPPPPTPPSDPHTYSKLGRCSQAPGNPQAIADAICAPTRTPNSHCTSYGGKPVITVKVDRCQPNGRTRACGSDPRGNPLAACLFLYEDKDTSGQTTSVRGCAAGDVLCQNSPNPRCE
jgi:hypothetical protein